MKNQTLFSSKDKSKTLKCRLQHCLFGALRVEPVLKGITSFAHLLLVIKTLSQIKFAGFVL